MRVQQFRYTIATPVLWLTLFLSAVIGIMWAFNCTVNLTASMPRGLWRVSKVIPPLELLRHKAVVFCPSDTPIFRWAKANGVLQHGLCPRDYRPLLKEVVGLPGDVIEAREDGVFLNGRLLPGSKIRKTLSIKCFRSREVIPVGHIWVMGVKSEASFDSRYFGSVSLTNVRGISEPLLLVD